MLKVHSTAPTASSLTITSAKIRSQVPSVAHLRSRSCAVFHGAVALRQVPPRRPGTGLPEDCVDHLPVVAPSPAPATGRRQQGLDPRRRRVGQLTATHHRRSIIADRSDDPQDTP
jgi:hypothetical protein